MLPERTPAGFTDSDYRSAFVTLPLVLLLVFAIGVCVGAVFL